MIKIQTYSDPFYDVPVSLDGEDFILSFAYNTREDAWRMSVSTADGTVIEHGVKLVPEIALLDGNTQPRRPAGAFYVFSTKGETPRLKDLEAGGDAELCYVTADDLAGG